jgi:hypothetical protein
MMVVDLAKCGNLNIVILAFKLINAHENFLIVNSGNPAKSCIKLLLKLESIEI